jgi:hypothetical protein
MKKLILFISIILLIASEVNANDCNSIMNEKVEEQVIKHLKNKNNDIQKLNTIKVYLERLCISTTQMNSIIILFDNIETKKEFHLYVKDYITDLENYDSDPLQY